MNEFEKRINLNFPLEILSQEVCKQYNLGKFMDNQLIKIGYEDYNYILTTSKGKFVVKVFSNLRTDKDCQNLADRGSIPHKHGFSCPKIYETSQGNLLITIVNGVKFRLLVMNYIDGKDFFTLNELPSEEELKIIAQETAKLNLIDYRPEFIYDKWAIVNFEKEYLKNKKYLSGKYKTLIEQVYNEFKTIDFSRLKYGFVHGDIIETNILRDDKNKLWFVDFSVSNYLPRIVDIAVTICDLCLDLTNIEISKQRTQIYLNEYEKILPLTKYEKQALKVFLKCHQAITIIQTTKGKVEDKNLSEENLKFLNKAKKGLDLLIKYDFIYETLNKVKI